MSELRDWKGRLQQLPNLNGNLSTLHCLQYVRLLSETLTAGNKIGQPFQHCLSCQDILAMM